MNQVKLNRLKDIVLYLTSMRDKQLTACEINIDKHLTYNGIENVQDAESMQDKGRFSFCIQINLFVVG